ncbi:maleylpyruvate isomerase N-terminal domain-containing protein [Kineosporia sp. NBRC 101731]|uniref:maleylpyruvate isomerase N-terminal domain-containing protein n=1 Tax=Kineosporia sp. NBRC 101731 TaxID=3032199 RepID=UPI0024A42C23|nr:maleylpyruvate isomerase N-terminal domain-containing protein [Kineosporia sp. NBRC 101731]GLY29376.1 hypothetical protein Kisp02_27410 [Kineosporia sp. NBRC 101731]
MTNPANRYDAVFLETLPPVAHLIDEPALTERWDQESVLAKMSVGALACHLNRQITLAHQLLSTPTDFPVLSGGADEHYARAAWVTTTSPDDPENDRSSYEEEARWGVHRLREATTRAAHEVTTLLTGDGAGELAGLPWQGWALRRDAFLLTRMLEVVVHADDLALSIGVPTPAFTAGVFEPVVELLARLAARRHGQSAVIGALSRRERDRGVSAF